MNKIIALGLVAFSALLVFCVALVFTRWSSGPLAVTGRQLLPAASPVAPAAADLLAVAPISKSTESGADALTPANTPVDATLQQAEADRRRAEAGTQAMAMLTSNLLDASLEVPRNPAEAGSLVGRSLADAARFRQKWGNSVPAAGTPEADEYAKEQETLVSESAAFLKFMADQKNSALLTQPDGIARFQEGSLASALDLRPDQVQGIDVALDGYYQQAFSQGLNSAARPPTGTDAWQAQRMALSQQSYAAVSAFLTQKQLTAFQRLFPPAGSWLFTASSPEVLGLDETR